MSEAGRQRRAQLQSLYSEYQSEADFWEKQSKSRESAVETVQKDILVQERIKEIENLTKQYDFSRSYSSVDNSDNRDYSSIDNVDNRDYSSIDNRDYSAVDNRDYSSSDNSDNRDYSSIDKRDYSSIDNRKEILADFEGQRLNIRSLYMQSQQNVFEFQN